MYTCEPFILVFCFIFDFRSAKCFLFLYSFHMNRLWNGFGDALSLFLVLCVCLNGINDFHTWAKRVRWKRRERQNEKKPTTRISSGCVCVCLFHFTFRLKQYYVRLYRQIETNPMHQTEHITSVSAIFKRIPIVLTPNYTRTALKPIAFSSYCCSDFAVLTVLPRSISHIFVFGFAYSFVVSFHSVETFQSCKFIVNFVVVVVVIIHIENIWRLGFRVIICSFLLIFSVPRSLASSFSFGLFGLAFVLFRGPLCAQCAWANRIFADSDPMLSVVICGFVSSIVVFPTLINHPCR